MTFDECAASAVSAGWLLENRKYMYMFIMFIGHVYFCRNSRRDTLHTCFSLTQSRMRHRFAVTSGRTNSLSLERLPVGHHKFEKMNISAQKLSCNLWQDCGEVVLAQPDYRCTLEQTGFTSVCSGHPAGYPIPAGSHY